jgi:hypothetical protein
MITIEGLTEQQRKLADIVWAIDSEHDLRCLRNSLRGQQQRDIDLVIELIVAAEIDRYVDTDSDCAQAREVLDSSRW